MDEYELEEILAQALKEWAKQNDLPIDMATIKEKRFSDDAGLIVRVGTDEFYLSITQTVFSEG